MVVIRVLCLALCALAGGRIVAAQSGGPGTSIQMLKKLSLQQLSDVEVTSVSRSTERLGTAAAAVTVVTNETIRRSGATTIPQALRFVPGIHVARQSANTWAVSARGFSSVLSEKLLVLSDTRSVYTPLVSGVFWDVQNFLMQDVDRIEVIRGPGATLWGSNAVNGVINIITKSARDTQGLYAETSGGTEERAATSVRYGGQLNERTFYRIYGSFVARDDTASRPGMSSDDWRVGFGGGRVDWESGDGRSLTIQGDTYTGGIGRLVPSVRVLGREAEEPTAPLDVDVAGGNVLGRYKKRTSDRSDYELRVYYDRTHRDDPSYLDDLHTVDAEYQHRLAVGAAHELTWGLSERLMSNNNRGKVIWNIAPPSSRDNIFSGFIQDQYTLRPGLHFTGGTKLERNDFSGFEVQPTGRVSWDVSPTRVVWGAVSRAVRVPTRFERDVAIDVSDTSAPAVARLLGNREFDSEKLVAYEVGHRWQLPRSVFIDVAAFHNRYTGLASLELELDGAFGEPTTGKTIVPIRNWNLTDGQAQGVEVLGTLTPRQNWRLTSSYSFLDLSLDTRGQDQNRGKFFDGATPRHQFGLRSFLDLPASFQLDAQLRSLSALRRLPPAVSGVGVSGYTELDVRVAWRGWEQIELSAVGQNLLSDRHPEFGPPEQSGEIQRGIYAKVAWGF